MNDTQISENQLAWGKCSRVDRNTAGERMGLEYDKGAIMNKVNQSELVADWVANTEVPEKNVYTLWERKKLY